MELFGLQIQRKKKEKEQYTGSPIHPEHEGDKVVEDTSGGLGGAYGYAHIMPDNEELNEHQLIKQYRRAVQTPEIESAVDEIVNECIISENGEKAVDVAFQDDDKISQGLRQKIKEQFDYIYSLMNFQVNGYEYFRSWYVDGKIAFYKNIDKQKKTIKSIQQIDSLKFRRIKNVTKTENQNHVPLVQDIEVYYEYKKDGFLTDNNSSSSVKLTSDSVAYSSSGLMDETKRMNLSYIHKALKPINQLNAIEDSIVIYRITRAPERRIFYIDVGNLPRQKAEQYVKDIMNRYKNKLVYNPRTGEIDDKRKYQTMLEDYWLPRREGGKGTQVDTLPGGQAMNQIEDLEYFLRKVYKSLNVPYSRFQQEGPAFAARASEINRDELKFARFAQRLRRRFSQVFYDLLRTQCILQGVVKAEEWAQIKDSIFFDYQKDSYFAEAKQLEMLQNKLNMMRDVEELVGKYFSREWVRKNVLMQDEDEINTLKKQIEKEKQEGEIEDDDGSPF